MPTGLVRSCVKGGALRSPSGFARIEYPFQRSLANELYYIFIRLTRFLVTSRSLNRPFVIVLSFLSATLLGSATNVGSFSSFFFFSILFDQIDGVKWAVYLCL